jgi:hypothetical protein
MQHDYLTFCHSMKVHLVWSKFRIKPCDDVVESAVAKCISKFVFAFQNTFLLSQREF